MGRTLPFTTSNTTIKTFRHALSLDEVSSAVYAAHGFLLHHRTCDAAFTFSLYCSELSVLALRAPHLPYNITMGVPIRSNADDLLLIYSTELNSDPTYTIALHQTPNLPQEIRSMPVQLFPLPQHRPPRRPTKRRIRRAKPSLAGTLNGG